MISVDRSEELRLTSLPTGPRLAPADVVDINDDSVVVSFEVQQVVAQLAMLDYEPLRGDRVLVIGDESSGYHVIGVLATARPRPKVKIDYDEQARVTTVSVENGDLQLFAAQGKVRLASTAGIDAMSGGPIDIQSGLAVRMSIVDRVGKALGRLGLTRRSVQLQHDDVQVDARQMKLQAQCCQLKAQDGRADVDSISLFARRASMQLTTLLSRVENAYHTVVGLWQLAADRTRMVVRGTSHHKAERIYSKADDVKVKADKIHLG